MMKLLSVLITFLISVHIFAQVKLNTDHGHYNVKDAPKALGFGDDKSNGDSRAKILAFVHNHLETLVGDKQSSAYFRPLKNNGENYDVTFSDESAALRFQQVLFYTNDEGEKEYVPFIGAQLVAYVNKLQKLPLAKNLEATINGELVEINSSIVNSKSFEDVLNEYLQKNNPFEIDSNMSDRAALLAALKNIDIRMIGNVLIERDVFTLSVEELKKILLEDEQLISNFLTFTKDKGKLIFNRQNKKDSYELVWRVVDPFKSSLVLDFHINEKEGKIIQNVHSIARHATVNIFRGTSFSLKRSKRRSGDSAKMQHATIDPGFFKQEDYDLALINISKVVEYFKDTFNWNSFDNKGSDVDATVRYKGSRLLGTAFLRQNAAWVGAPYNQFIFGRGGDEIGDFLGAFDVIGHEYCHAVIAHSSALTGGNETGALNEHLCDILGVGLESYVEGRAYDFAIGEKVVLEDSRALRDFLNPEKSFSPQASHMNDVMKRFGPNCKVSQENDECGVHYSNGVLNKVVGRSIVDLGWTRVRDLVFEVTTKKLLSSSQFLDYKRQMVGTCRQLNSFSANDCDIIESHFNDNGVSEDVINSESPSSLSGQYNEMICQVLSDSCETFSESEVLPEMSEMCRECGY